MRNIVLLMTLALFLGGNSLSAQTQQVAASCGSCNQTNGCEQPKKKNKNQPAPCPKDETALVLGFCGLVVAGVVAGVAGWMGSQSSNP